MEDFKLTVDMTNSAFNESPTGELARILREVAKRVEDGQFEAYVKDANGNKVGRFSITETVGDPAPHRKAARDDRPEWQKLGYTSKGDMEQVEQEDKANLRSTRHGMN